MVYSVHFKPRVHVLLFFSIGNLGALLYVLQGYSSTLITAASRATLIEAPQSHASASSCFQMVAGVLELKLKRDADT